MADGKVTISTALDNRGFQKGVGQVSGALGGLKSVAGKLGVAIAAAFSVRQIVQFGTESVRAANELANALKGLQSIMEGQGRSFSEAQAFIEEYTKDGLIPATNAITAYKNLAMRGYDDNQIKQVMIALKDASAFGRQSSYSMGEAVQSATEGLKNENSILVDNAGVTKNVAKMWEEYARSIGTTSNNLTQQQKIQAEVNGILEESKYQSGDAAKVAGTFSGQLSQLSFNFNKLKIAVGNAIIPIAQQLLPVVNDAIAAMTGFANSIAAVVGALFGRAEITTTNEAIAESAKAGADAEQEFASGISSAAKAAKKSLAGFDELNVLQSNAASGGGGGAASGSTDSTGKTVAEAEVKDTISPKIQSIVEKIQKLIKPLKNIDLGPMKKALKDFGEELQNLGEIIGEDLEWAWFNILVPLATWIIEKAGPKSVELLTTQMQFLSDALEPISEGVEDLFSKLSPVFEWVGDTALGVLDNAIGQFQMLSDVITENGPEIEGIISGIGDIAVAVWKLVEPLITKLQELDGKIRSFVTELKKNFYSAIIGVFSGIIDFIAGVFTGDWDRAFAGIEETFESCKEFLSDTWESIQELFSGVSEWVDENIIQPVSEFFSGLGSDISETASDCWENVKEAWDNASSWFDETVIQPVAGFFSDTWESVTGGAEEAWKGVKEAFSTAGKFFSDTFTEAWEKVKEVFSPLGEVFVDIKGGVLEGFKEVVNKLIDGINNVVAIPFNGINDALKTIRDIEILKHKPFAGLPTISVPKIPYLAQGAVLPPNKPFMAMVGDQRHGTNIEAPLDTIKQAVAEVLGDFISSNVAGHEATVAVLQEILAAVLGIEIGPETVAEMVNSYNRQMAIVRGRA